MSNYTAKYMINPNPSKIENILELSRQFVVPKYQREYTWGKNEALEFIEDLKSYADSNDGGLFLGTMIFDIAEEKEKKINIVDGQQRITTISLLLIACRTVAKKINEVGLATLIQNKITFTDPTTAESLGCRLIASESIRDVFEEISKFDWNGEFTTRVKNRQVKRQVNRIKPIYDFFLSEIQNYDKKSLSNFLKAVYESYVVRIDIEDEVEAFKIFERTNARGVDLEASDLLKNYLFAQGVDGLEEVWSRIIENSEGTILRMLKYFYVSKKGYVAKADLYKKIKIYGKDVGPNRLVDELEKFSHFFNMARSADASGVKNYFESIGCSSISEDQEKYETIHSALEGLRLFKISQMYPLIYSALNCFVRSGEATSSNGAKKLVHLFQLMEKYHFINNAVCERVGNEVEKPYADYCLRYEETKDFLGITAELEKQLRQLLASEDEFISRFTEISYVQSEIPLIAYIFDRINNIGRHQGQKIKLFNSEQRLSRRNHNIEHFLPQKPEEDLAVDQETREVVDNIGNLLVISFRTNSRLQNVSPEKKILKLKKELSKEIENLSYVTEFIEKYGEDAKNWNKKAITKRAREMAEEAYKNVWKV